MPNSFMESSSSPCLREQIAAALDLYLLQVNGDPVANLYDVVVEQLDIAVITTALKHADGNQTKAAKLLGISRSTLRSKINKLGLN